MLKFLADRGKEKLIGFGLSEGNLHKLREGKPIAIDLLEMNLPWNAKILIFYGKTEKDMEKELRAHGLISNKTEIHIDPKLE